MTNLTRFLIQALGSLVCFWWLFRMVSPDLLADSLRRSNYVTLSLVTAIMIPAVLARAWRWHYLLARRGVQVPFGSITHATFMGMALNLFLPASAGDVVRSYYGWQRHGHKEAMLASTLADKGVALFSLFLLGALGGLFCGDRKLALLAAVLIIPTGFILLVPVRWLWKVFSVLVRRLLKKEFDVDLLLTSFHMSLSTFVGALTISVIGWMITNLMYYFAVLSVHAHVELSYVFASAPLINIVRMLPVSISGLGSADALMIELFGAVGIENHLTLAASMIINLTLIVLPGVAGAVLMVINLRGLNRPESITKTLISRR